MESYSSVTPRLRVARNTSLNYDRSVSQIATATDGPSHFPEFSQLVDMNLNEMAPSVTSEQPSTSTIPGPSTSVRSENPAAVLRALLSRLPAESKGLQPPRSPSQQYLSERESDYDMDLTEPTNATRSIVQENLKDIFTKARRDPGDTPQKMRIRHDSDVASDKSPATAATVRDDSKGKRRSMSDDELDNAHGLSHRPATRFKHSPQPVTLEFLRERFSESRLSSGSVEDDERPPSIHHNFSNDAGNDSQDMNSFQTNIPVATSTPQQSLRISVNSQFQSNLLDQDTEMQHAIDDLDSYGENSVNRPISPPPILWKRPMSRSNHLNPSASNSLEDDSKTPAANRFEFRSRRDLNEDSDQDHQNDDWGQPQISRESNHARRSNFVFLDESTPRGNNRGQSTIYRSPTLSRDGPSRSDNAYTEKESAASTTPPRSPPNNVRSTQSLSQENSSKVEAENHDYDEVESTSKSGRKWDSPYPAWNTPPARQPLTPPSVSPPRTANSRLRSNSFQTVNQSKEEDNHLQGEPSTSASDFSTSPLHPSRSSSGLGRSSSLQAIDNTYRNNDPSLRHRLRSLSPLPSSSKVESKSPNISDISKKSKADVAAWNRKQGPSSLRDWTNQSSSQDPSMKSTSSSHRIHASSSWKSHLDSNGEESEKTDISSHDKMPTMKNIAHSDVSDFAEEERPARPPSRASSRLSNAPVIPQVLVQDQTPSPKDILLSPSIPLSRHTPKNIKRKHKLPSPTKGPPDLPTPSSSDESEHSRWSHTATPKPITNGASNASWLPTPRPPGGWLQTPMPSRTRSRSTNHDAEEHSTSPNNENNTDSGRFEQKTPLRVANTTSSNTPRPPGAWQTPAPASKLAYATPRNAEQIQEPLSPAPSIKGLMVDPKTPYVPGGWAATPAARKSILKVRFNQEAEGSFADDALAPRSRTSGNSTGRETSNEDPSSSPGSLRSTQTSGLRILDAYGRQPEPDEVVIPNSTPSRNALRVVDAMGREVHEPDQTTEDEHQDEDEDYHPSSRAELLSRIRRGLDNLVEDIDEIDRENHARLNDDARMEELNALSMQARKNRELLRDQAAELPPTSILSQPFGSKSSPPNRRRYVAMILMQILLSFLMYRFLIQRTKQLFLNSYFDPFHPDLYLYIFKYDTSFQLLGADFGRTSPQTFGDALQQGGGRILASFWHLISDVQVYFWKLWTTSLQSTTWAPT